MKRYLALLAGALACVIAVLAVVPASKAVATGPSAAVKGFLIDGTLDRNGFAACSYLTSPEQRAISAAGEGQSCRQAIDTGGAQLRVGRTQVSSLGQLKRLGTTETIHGGRAWVWLSDGSARAEYELVKADAAEQQEFQAPNTGWRISAGPGLPTGKTARSPAAARV